MNESHNQFDQQLHKLWSLDMPPAQDAAFLFAIFLRIQQRGLRISMLLLALHSVAIAWVCWLILPTLNLMVELGSSTLDGIMTPLAAVLVFVALIELRSISN